MTTEAVVRVELRGAMAELRRTTDSVIIAGPAGTGKTWQTLMWLHLVLLRHPGTRALLVRKVHRSLTGTTLTTFREQVAAEAIGAGIVAFYSGSSAEPASFRYENGSRLVVGGLDEPQKIMGSEVSVIVIDEAIETTPRDIDMLRTRLRGAVPGSYPHYRMVLLTNPGPPTHHLKTRSDIRMATSTHRDNPVLWQDGAWTAEGRRYMAELDKLSGVELLRLRDGVWAAAEGVIWPGFDPSAHVVPRFDVPHDWPLIVGVDFGYTHPFAAQFWRLDGDGRLYLQREILRAQRLVEDHAKDMKRIIDEIGTRPLAIVCDHQAEDRATLKRHLGFGTTPARKAVSEGIQAVASRFKTAGDGRPRLMLMENAIWERDPELEAAGRPTCLADEIPGYVWSDHKTREQPVKERDDACDALRYVVQHVDNGSRPRVRWI